MSWRSWGDTSSTRGRSSAATAPGRPASWGCLSAGLAGGGTGATELEAGTFVLHNSCELRAWGPTWGSPGGASNPLLNPWVRPADWAVGRGFRSTSLGPAAGSHVTSFDVARESWPSAVARGVVTMGAAGVSRVTSLGWAAGACCWRMVVASKETELPRRTSVAVKSTMPTLWSATGTSCLMDEGSPDVVASPEEGTLRLLQVSLRRATRGAFNSVSESLMAALSVVTRPDFFIHVFGRIS